MPMYGKYLNHTMRLEVFWAYVECMGQPAKLPSYKDHFENTPIKIYWINIKNGKFSDKSSDIFHISAQNIDCGYSLEPLHRGGSNEYPQSMFLSRNKKNNVYPYKPQFYFMKVGFKGVKII